MIYSIALKEFKTIIRERRFLVASLLLSLVFIFSLYSAYSYYTGWKEQHNEAARTARSLWENQEEKNPHSAAHYGAYVFKPIYPLSFFDRGIDAYTGNTLFLEAHKMNEAKHRLAFDQGEFARLGTLSPAFVLSMLFPLFILILGFGAISSEWESHNLRLLWAQGTRPAILFLGKALGLWMAVGLLAVPFLILGGAGLFMPGADAESVQRYAWIALGYLLYLGIFIHLTLLLSALAKRSNVALVASLGAWIFICLIAPKAAVNMAKWQYPTPSWMAYQEAVTKDLEQGVDGHDPTSAYTERIKQETLKAYNVASTDSLPFNWSGFIMQKGEEHETYVFQKHKDQLLAIYQQQQAVLEAASALSPFLLTTMISQRLAATDIESYHHFLAAAEQYRIQLVGELNADLTYNFKPGDFDGTRGKAFFASNKEFEYKALPLSHAAPKARLHLAGLLLWFVLSGLLGVWITQKLKPA